MDTNEGWAIFQFDGYINIVPVNDTKVHVLSVIYNDEDKIISLCKCEPRIEIQPNGVAMIVHSSYDGREAMEEVNEILN
jgi:hypothetical protein